MTNLPNNCLRQPKLYVLLVLFGIAIPIVSSLGWSIINYSIVGSINFKKTIDINSVAQVLTMLFLVATFLERSLEVYMITFRKPGENDYGVDGTITKSDDPKTLNEYKNETSKIALWSALTIGIVISMTGIRGIEPFIDLTQTETQTEARTPTATAPKTSTASTTSTAPTIPTAPTTLKPTNWQIYWFRISDILLTGGVIAGGSDFIHKILQIFTTFMDATAMAQKSTEAKSKAEIAKSNEAVRAIPATSNTIV
jgi:hypothetical protein